MANHTHKGACMCGAVQIEAKGDPVWTATCHCADCRHATGAAMAGFAGYETENVKIEGGDFCEFESSTNTRRGFCGKCGTRLTCRMESYPTQTHFHVGIFEDADVFAPMGNVYVKDKLKWVHLEENIPSFQTTPNAEKN